MGKTATAQKTITKRPIKKLSLPRKTQRGKRPQRRVKEETNQLIALAAAEFAIEKKATDVKILDVRDITSLTDYFVLCSGSSALQVKAIAENVLTKMRERGIKPWKSEGWGANEWIIVDFVDVVVHVFSETARSFYHLERLWSDAPQQSVLDKAAKKK